MKQEIIRSTQNPIVKFVASLKEKKFREREGLFLVEGRKMVTEGFARGADIQTVYATEKFLGVFPEEKTVYVSEEVFRKMSDEVSPEGVLATLKLPNFSLTAPTKTCVFLDAVRDPGNMGTIIRTCAACGVTDIYAADSCDPYNPKVIRSSMSGIYAVRIHRGTREELLSVIKDMPIVVADMGGKDVFKEKVALPICLVVGNEANGVSDCLKNAATQTVALPMANKMESLNAAVSLSVLLYTLIYR